MTKEYEYQIHVPDLGSFLKGLLVSEKISLKTIAQELGISQSSLSHKIRHVEIMERDIFVHICKKLELNPKPLADSYWHTVDEDGNIMPRHKWVKLGN